MRILVIGAGGREHALAWRLAQEPGVTRVLAAPGNPGIARVAELLESSQEPAALADLAERAQIDLTVVGPELPLSQGLVDVFQQRQLPVIGPTRAAAALETSKAFAKSFMARRGIPTAQYRICDAEQDAQAIVASGELGWPLVVKADGLAAGKGVVVATDASTASGAIADMMQGRRFGSAGARVVLEECLEGAELSFFVLSDGQRAIALGTAQDHKRAFDDDRGPNTGGMGAFSPSPLCDAALHDVIMRDIVAPAIAGMREEGYPYTGFLYCGLMITPQGPRVIEFNVRFGDPEAQVVLPLLAGDLLGALRAAATGTLDSSVAVSLTDQVAVGVVIASGGYPDAFRTGHRITGVSEAASVPNVLVFHAGTALTDGQLVTAGGRVLTIVGRGSDFSAARAAAYRGASHIGFERLQFRRDIGIKALHQHRTA